MDTQDYFNQFHASSNQEFSIVIEDNGYVAYAYLLKNEDIISELWLYNRGNILYDNWDNISEDDFPLQNLDCFINKTIKPISTDKDINIKWSFNDDNNIKAYIFIHDELIGSLESKEPIGFSKLVFQDTPIAKKYD